MSGRTSLRWTEQTIGSFHARLLVLMAEHAPVVRRHLLDDQLDVECACGNPLYTGHLVRLVVALHAKTPCRHAELPDTLWPRLRHAEDAGERRLALLRQVVGYDNANQSDLPLGLLDAIRTEVGGPR